MLKPTILRNAMQEEKSILAKILLHLLEGVEYNKYTKLENDDLICYTSQHDRYTHVRTQDMWKMMGKILFAS